MSKIIFFLLGCFLICTAFSVPQKLLKKADKVISKFYETDNFKKETISISEVLNDATPTNFADERLFKIVVDGTHQGYGYIGNAPSKTATYDYLVLFDNQFIITKSKVLIYREEYGGEIGSKRWLRQFIGASSKSEELVYNTDIIPIAGATISVRTMTKAMNDLLKSISILQQKNAF
jgi:hypothetical protein